MEAVPRAGRGCWAPRAGGAEEASGTGFSGKVLAKSERVSGVKRAVPRGERGRPGKRGGGRERCSSAPVVPGLTWASGGRDRSYPPRAMRVKPATITDPPAGNCWSPAAESRAPGGGGVI